MVQDPTLIAAIAGSLAFPTAVAWFLLKAFVGRFNGKLDALKDAMHENTEATEMLADVVKALAPKEDIGI